MKRFLKFLFCLTLGTTLLTGCNKEDVDFAKNDFRDIYFSFMGSTSLGRTGDFLFDAPVIDIINLSEDEFVNQYLPTKIQNKYDYYTFRKAHFDTFGFDYVFEYE